ncbi:MAG: hypothetical protein PHV40_02700 [Candidatus Omnitrophica bacterium]|nr:hypothetical protein [Candidatus Omnitrophota bacterium]MDD5501066.1 hypothetical protein [Candidatus Omnitrophota bacterium]
MQKKVILFFALVLLIFLLACVYLWVSRIRLKESLEKDLASRATHQGSDLKKLKKQKEKLKKAMEEKYRADMISYKAVEKRLELQAKKEAERRAAPSNKK